MHFLKSTRFFSISLMRTFFCLAILSVLLSSGEALTSDNTSSAPTTREGARKQRCRYLYGVFTSHVLPPDDCESPVGICTLGTLKGSLKGEYEMVTNQMFPTGELDIPDVSFFSGSSVIRLTGGETIRGIDTGSLNGDTSDGVRGGEFSSMLTMVEGRRGYLHIVGHLNFNIGVVTGTYSGKMCPL